MQFRSLAVVASLAALAAPGVTADREINDVRFILGFTLANDTELEADGGDAVGTELDGWRVGARFARSVAPLMDWGGWVYGGELFYDMQDGEFEDDGGDLSISTIGVQGFFGYAYGMRTLPLHFEAYPFLELGYATTDVDVDDDSALLWDVGLGAGAYWTFVNRWQLGADLRYTITGNSQPSFEGADVDVNTEGILQLVLSVGYRF